MADKENRQQVFIVVSSVQVVNGASRYHADRVDSVWASRQKAEEVAKAQQTISDAYGEVDVEWFVMSRDLYK